MDSTNKFERDLHIRFFKQHLDLLPKPYGSQDTNRLTLAYFCLSALDVLNALDVIKDKKSIIEWVYNLQVIPDDFEGV